MGIGKQKVELVGGRDVGGAASPCSTLSSILAQNSSGLISSVFLNMLVVLRNLTTKGEKLGCTVAILPPHCLVTVVHFVARLILCSCVETATNQVVITLFALVPVQKV